MRNMGAVKLTRRRHRARGSAVALTTPRTSRTKPGKTYEEIEDATERVAGAYYNTPQGFWDRLQFISIDDAMINITDQGKVFGLAAHQAGSSERYSACLLAG